MRKLVDLVTQSFTVESKFKRAYCDLDAKACRLVHFVCFVHACFAFAYVAGNVQQHQACVSSVSSNFVTLVRSPQRC